MPYYNQNQGRTPKKQVINKWEGIGIVRPRSAQENDALQFFAFPNGGGALHFSLLCTEITGADANGAPKTRTTYLPVKVYTNKNITEQQLRSIVSGMKLRCVGSLQHESYTSKKTGQKVSALVLNAYVIEILEAPMQGQYPPQPYGTQYPYPQPQQGGPAYQQPYPEPAPGPQRAPAQAPQYQPQPQYGQAPAQGPQYQPQPQYGQAPAPAPQYQPQPQYGQAPAQAPAQAQPQYQPQPQPQQQAQPQQQQAQAAPPYYRPAPAPQAAPAPVEEDMPEDMTY